MPHESIERLIELQRIPTREDIAALLGEYFVGPIDEWIVERLSDEFAAVLGDPQVRTARELGFRANSRDYQGQASGLPSGVWSRLPTASSIAWSAHRQAITFQRRVPTCRTNELQP